MNKQRIILFLSLIFVVLVVGVYGYQLEAWTGFPKGIDAYARITRIVYILDFFPHVFWQYHWANGMPTFQSEGPLFYFAGALIAKLFSLKPEIPLFPLGFLSFVFIGLGVWGYVYTLTKKSVSSLLAAIITLSSYDVWFWMTAGGIYPRILGVGLSMMSLWFVSRLVSKMEETQTLYKGHFLLAVIFMALTVIDHALMGFFSWLTIGLMILVGRFSFSQKIRFGLMIFLSAFSLAGFFLLPALFSFGTGSSHFIGVVSEVIPVPWSYLFDQTRLGILLLPTLFLSFLAVLILKKARNKIGESETGLITLILPALAMFLLFLLYGLIGYTGLPGRYYYINGFIPSSATLFMAIYGSILVGLLFSRLEKGYGKVITIMGSFGLIIITFYSLFYLAPYIKNHDNRGELIHDTGEKLDRNDVYVLKQILKFQDPNDFNHRFAAYDAFEAVWFNAVYNIPQVRDYYGQGILYPDWRYWFEQAVWNKEKFSLDETKAALDWFAVKWFSDFERDAGLIDYGKIVTPVAVYGSNEEFLKASQNRYIKNEQDFTLVSSGRLHADGFHEEFVVNNPSAILTASNAPATLFIGDTKSYNLLFSNLTFTNYNSSKLIPVRGKLYLDDYSLNELKAYTSLVLFNYRYHNQKRAYKMLADYLKEGGNILWEAWDSPELLNEKGTSKDIPEPSPFSTLDKNQIQGIWDFQKQESSLFTDVDFALFSPPLYNGTPWKFAKGSNLRPWAKVILNSQKGPLIVSGKFGNGKIVWTSFNFLYHINSYKNLVEAKLLTQFFTDFGASGLTNPAMTTFINPEKRELAVSETATGVLFKESYFPSWKAYVKDAKNKKTNLSLELAGPGMMYAPLPKGMTYPLKVTVEYTHPLIVKIGFGITILSVLFLIIFSFNLLSSEKMKTTLDKVQKPLSSRTKTWLSDEDS